MENLNNRSAVREEFKFFLSNVAHATRSKDATFNLGNSAVTSYLSFIEPAKLFDYAPEKWGHIKSMYDLTDPIKVRELANQLLLDPDFKQRDSKDNQGFRSAALTHYVCFINAKDYFKTGKSKSESFSPTKGSLQQIFYGAPGTGKSHGIDVETKGKKVIRTTFHPDSDYSTFVGAYKPVMREVPTMTVIGTKSVPVEDYYGKHLFEKKIEYDFIPQAFTEAYVEAWKDLQRPVYLVIEEINRGNCAQIFGDIFQLLDRDENGYSSYMITPDEDLHRYLAEVLDKEEDSFDAVCPLDNSDVMEIWGGEKMCLPPNLHIWATMNTSDQSLFPIDSAFKRRWDWKYTPISDAGKGYHIDVNGNSYDWWSFLEKVNEIVEDMTSSEDKQLGYFFCKAEDGVISAEKFVGKVIFYLWNDVFKDYGFDRDIFKYEEDGKKKTLTFRKFFNADGTINEVMAEKFLTNLEVKEAVINDIDDTPQDDDADTGLNIVYNGEVIKEKNDLETYVKALEKIGIARIEPLKIKCYNQLIVSVEPQGNYSWRTVDGYKILTFKLHRHMERILKQIADDLKLDLTVEMN